MKKPDLISKMFISLMYLSPLFLAIYFREKFFHSINTDRFDLLSGMIIVPYGVHVFKYFRSLFKPQVLENQSLNSRLSIVWAFFYLSISVLIFYYAYHNDSDMGYNPLVILLGVFLMIDGNYQSVIMPKNVAYENGMGEGYEENVYKKSQRLRGRFQFYFGLVVFILFVILPNTSKMWLYGIFGIITVYYIGGWIFMYKNTQIIANSEVKTK